MTNAGEQALVIDESIDFTGVIAHSYPVCSVSQPSCTIACVVGGVSSFALIDSGSSVSILNSGLVHTLPDVVCVPQPDIALFAVNRLPLSITGAIQSTVCVAGCTFTDHLFLVSPDVGPQVILGKDFMEKSQALLDFSGGQFVLRFPDSGTHAGVVYDEARVALLESVEIPPYYCSYVTCECTQRVGETTVIIQSNDSFAERFPLLEVGEVVIASADTESSFLLPVFNRGGDPIKLFKNTHIGRASSCTVDCTDASDTPSFVSTVSDNDSVPCTWDSHLNDLLALHDDLSSDNAEILSELLSEFKDVFWWDGESLGRCSIYPHCIDTGTAVPIKQASRRLPYYRRAALKLILNNLLEAGIIRESCSPWASPIVLVSKKDGSTRLCVDYRQLNKVTKPDAFPLPRIDDTIDSLHGCTLFTTLDLASGYWQISLDEHDSCKSAFTCPLGLYEFTVLPMGVSNGPATFQRVMERVLRDVLLSSSSPLCRVFFDDILVASSSLSDHVDMLRQVFERLRKAGLKLKLPKCRFLKQNTEFLGFSVSGHGVATCADKVAKVRDWPTPSCVKEVQQFLGLAGYYRRFIKGFSKIAAPLHGLTHADSSFLWTPACAAAFRSLKSRLIAAPVLAYPDFSEQGGTFILDTDASKVGIGAVLSQVQEGVERVIAFGSQVLTKAQRNYSTYDRELLAVVTFASLYRCYLLGNTFTLRTDHQALRSLFSSKEPTGRRARWIEYLAEFQYDIVHRPGRIHTNADALSRLPCVSSPLDQVADAVDVSAEDSSPPLEDITQSDPSPPAMVSAASSNVTFSEPVSFVSTDELHSAQASDPVLSIVLSWYDQGTGSFVRPPEDELSGSPAEVRRYAGDVSLLRFSNDVLFYSQPHEDTDLLLLAVPQELRKLAVQSVHCLPGGHQGQDKTLAKCRQRFHWYGMSEFVRTFVRCCAVCEQSSRRVGPGIAPLGSMQTGFCFERVGIDLVGPLSTSATGYRYMLVCIDYFSRWVEAYPLSDIRADTVTRAFVDGWVSRFGAPVSVSFRPRVPIRGGCILWYVSIVRYSQDS